MNLSIDNVIFSYFQASGTVTATALIEITVQSLSFPYHQDNGPIESHQHAIHKYMTPTIELYKNIVNNFNSCFTNLQDFLFSCYDCETIEIKIDGTLTLKIGFAPEKIVTLQCDNSSGSLNDELERILLTKSMLSLLGVQEIKLTTDVKAL